MFCNLTLGLWLFISFIISSGNITSETFSWDWPLTKLKRIDLILESFFSINVLLLQKYVTIEPIIIEKIETIIYFKILFSLLFTLSPI